MAMYHDLAGFEPAWAWLVPFSVTLFMSALYYDAPVVALQGAALLIATTWKYTRDST